MEDQVECKGPPPPSFLSHGFSLPSPAGMRDLEGARTTKAEGMGGTTVLLGGGPGHLGGHRGVTVMAACQSYD
jgi:hypothetical protein